MALERGSRPNTITQPKGGDTVADDKTKVRTSINPGEVIEVDSTELLDLSRQGLIHSREGDETWQDAEPVEVESGVITDGLNEQATTGDVPAADRADTTEAPASIDDKPEPLAERVKRVSAKGKTERGE